VTEQRKARDAVEPTSGRPLDRYGTHRESKDHHGEVIPLAVSKHADSDWRATFAVVLQTRLMGTAVCLGVRRCPSMSPISPWRPRRGLVPVTRCNFGSGTQPSDIFDEHDSKFSSRADRRYPDRRALERSGDLSVDRLGPGDVALPGCFPAVRHRRLRHRGGADRGGVLCVAACPRDLACAGGAPQRRARTRHHAVAVRRGGPIVRRIPNPGAELRIAGIGPLVSLLLGVVFFGVAGVLKASGYEGLVLASFAWLGGINIALAVFNVIPAAPLDGGRLLRSIIWWRTGDRLKATRWSSRTGQIFGWVLVALGLVTFFTGGDFGGLWLALIGWFLAGAATAESQQATVRGQLGELAIRDIMTLNPVTAPASMTVQDLLNSDLIRHRHSTFPLTEDGGAPISLVTFNQIRRVAPQARATTRLRDIACPLEQVAQARPEEPAADLLPRLSECAEGRALVLSDGVLVGIVSPSDVSRVLRWMGVPGNDPQRV
jgi:CBS domain-containing protein